MTISKRDGTMYNNSGTAWQYVDFTKHTGTATGDFVIVVASFWENGYTPTFTCTGTGWTFTELGEYLLADSGTNESRVKIWRAEIGGGEAGSFRVDAGGGVSVLGNRTLFDALWKRGTDVCVGNVERRDTRQ